MHLEELTRYVLPDAAEPPATSSSLRWELPESVSPPSPLVEAVGPSMKWANLGDFSAHLRNAGVMDTRHTPVPGMSVTLPFGVRLGDLCAAEVMRVYEQWGLEPHEYPSMMPLESLEHTRQILEIDRQVFYVADYEDLAAHKPSAVLCPTGEGVIYAHWSRAIKTKQDLPITLYRRTTYYRPQSGRSGLGVFRSPESRDMFELFACFATAQERKRAASRYEEMFRHLMQRFCLPALFSTRPPWTNRGEVALRTVGGDVPLPNGATKQAVCLYEQGQIFSKAFGIAYREGGEVRFTEHVTGSASRRLMLIQLLLGMDRSGALFMHPRFAPDQIVVMFRPGSEDDRPGVTALVGRLGEKGVRVRLNEVDAHAIRSAQRVHRLRGVPLQVCIFGRRSAKDMFRVVVARSDTYCEAVIHTDDLDRDVLPHLLPLLDEIGAAYARRVAAFAARQIHVTAGHDLEESLKQRRVVVCPLVPVEKVVRQVASWNTGEVLGFARSGETQPCALTGDATTAVAFVSPRF